MTEKVKDKREVVVPGEIIAKGDDILPGEWTIKQGEDIIATRLGIIDKQDRLVKIIPLSGVYIPRAGNVVIGEIKDIAISGWMIDIGAPYSAFLPLRECQGFIEESEMEGVYGIGDLIITKILDIKRTSIDLTMKQREKGLGKIRDGLIIKVNPHRVPRIIGKEGSMIKLIKDASGCSITVGQNGIIWIKGDNIENKLFAKEIINFVIENTITEGLTEKVEGWIKENRKDTLKILNKTDIDNE